MDRVLEEYDATEIVGIRTIVCGAAILDDEDDTVEVPNLRELMAAAVVARCLMPIRLRGFEIKAIRKIMRCTLAELATKMDARTAPETVSRWESDAQLMGGYAEKILRLVACETLKSEAPGVDYKAAMIAELVVVDPWRTDAAYEVPHVVLSRVRIKEQSGSIIDAWDLKHAA
jgi:DNA-binding transcriptional regulator YiaG